MAKTPQISREKIMDAAVELIRSGGEAALNARALAKALGCSTQPIFRNYSDMGTLREALLTEVHNRYLQFMVAYIAASEAPPYKASGMAYITYAGAEPELFRMLFMRARAAGTGGPEQSDWEPTIAAVEQNTGLPHGQAELFHLELWAIVHGIAVMQATGYLPLEEKTISRILTDAFFSLKQRMEESHERN